MEEILKKQIEELEKLVRIQNEVIQALKSQQTVQIQYVPYYQQPHYNPYQYPHWGTYGQIQAGSGFGYAQNILEGAQIGQQYAQQAGQNQVNQQVTDYILRNAK